MDARDKIPHMLRHLDVPRASAKAAASMVEVGVTLTTWPQLAGDVILGATAIAEAVRRIGLGERLQSGRSASTSPTGSTTSKTRLPPQLLLSRPALTGRAFGDNRTRRHGDRRHGRGRDPGPIGR